MAIAEACQLWIEQRIEEELQDKGENGKSLREIGRELAAEIEKVFEAKVDPITLTMRASRMKAVTNVTPPETPATTPKSVATSGYKPKPQEVAKRVEALVEKGASIREAAKAVAEETGKTPASRVLAAWMGKVSRAGLKTILGPGMARGAKLRIVNSLCRPGTERAANTSNGTA